MRFPRLDLWTRDRNAATGRYLMLEWGWYRLTARLFGRELLAWAYWRAAYRLPREVAYIAFIRVYASSQQAPGPDFVEACKAWEERRDLQPPAPAPRTHDPDCLAVCGLMFEIDRCNCWLSRPQAVAGERANAQRVVE